MNESIKCIRDYVEARQLFSAGDQLVIGLSGGPDSVFLLEALYQLQEVLEIGISCVHVNHGIRGDEAERDQAFCMRICTQKDIPCTVICVDAPAYAREKRIGLEESSRILRYQALEKVRSTLEALTGLRTLIAVAHHGDDQAETILHNLFRGTGLRGLSGMEPRNGNIVRPILCMARSEISTYLEKQNIEYVLDSSNGDLAYTRNRIRAEIMPAARRINPQAAAHINQTAVFVSEADALLRELAVGFADTQTELGEQETGLPFARVSIKALKAQKPLLRRYILMELLRRLVIPLKDWGVQHFYDLEALLDKQGGAHLDLPCKVCADKKKGYLVLTVHREVISMKQRRKENFYGR